MDRLVAEDAELIGGTRRARKRPAHIVPPAHWVADDGPPEPQATPHIPQKINDMPDPVRYGDWERKGIAVDF